MLCFYQHTYSKRKSDQRLTCKWVNRGCLGCELAMSWQEETLPAWLHFAIPLQMRAYSVLLWPQGEKFAPSLSHSELQSVGDHFGGEILEAGGESRLFCSVSGWPSQDKESFRTRTGLEFLQLQSRKMISCTQAHGCHRCRQDEG